MSEFASVTSIGGLLPSNLLTQVSTGDKDLEGTAPDSYDLVPGERLNDHITRSWNRLTTVWALFSDQFDQLPNTESTGTTLTRERWLRPLLDELGFGGLNQAQALVIDGKDYAISHRWGDTVPVHLLGAKVPIDRRSPGIPGAAKSSPHGLVQEFLNRSEDHLWALLTNGHTLRLLRDNASLTRQAYVEFDLQAIFEGELYSDFALLWLTCHRTRFEGDPPEKCHLEQWSQHAASAGTRALDRLRDGVEAAIENLGEGFLAHPANTELRQRLTDGSLSTADYQRQLLRVIYRLLFLLVAEARDLLLAPGTDEVTRIRYRDHYSLGRIARLARVRRGSTHDDLWESLAITIESLWRDGQPALGLAPLGSFLWSPDSTEALAGARLDNAHLLEAVRQLTLTRDAEAKIDRTVDYRNLGAEELGSIYESLLELHARIDVPARKFALDTAAGNERKTTGSYYTPTSLINELLDSALEPVLDEAAHASDPEAEILGLSVLDPACGSGHFLIAAANRIAQRLASVRAGGIEPAPDEVRQALRDVVGRCLHGIDVNPMAVELCKVSLWLEATEPGKPLSFLDHRIVCGNALLGTTPRLLAGGIPDDAYKALDGDDKKVVSELKKRNKKERKGQGTLGLFDDAVGAAVEPVRAVYGSIDAIPDDTADQIRRKADLLAALDESPEAAKATLAADAWCAAFVAPKGPSEPPITTATVRQLIDDPSRLPHDILDRIRTLAESHRFVHLHLAFPDVISVPADLGNAENERTGWDGGFSVVLGNPPWDMVQLSEKEFFAERNPDIAGAPGATRKRMIVELEDDDPHLFLAFKAEQRRVNGVRHFLAQSDRYPLCGRGKINTYSVFAEAMRDGVGPSGRVGLIVPSGIATDDTTKYFFQDIVERRNLASLFDFENRKPIFLDVHRSYKFCLLTLAGDQRPVDEAEFLFFGYDTADLNDPERRFTLTPDDFALLNPNTRTCPIFRTRRDAEITKGIYSRVPVLVEEGPPEKNPWGVTFRQGLFNMTSDSHLFRTREQLEADGWTLQGNIFTKGPDRYLPLYEAKMVHHFDHRWATYECGQTRDVMEKEKEDPCFVVIPRYWVRSREVSARSPAEVPWTLGWRDIARSTDERTVIAGVIPAVGVGNKFPVRALEGDLGMTIVSAADQTSFVHDFVGRQKIGGATLNFFIYRQLPNLVPHPIDPLVVARAKELLVTAWDIGAALGCDPFPWDQSRRELLRVELDSFFFHRYGIKRHDVAYIMDTFPIVCRKDEAKYGEYRTKRLILEVYDRMAEAIESGQPYETLLDPPPADPSLCHDPSTRPDWADLYLPASER